MTSSNLQKTVKGNSTNVRSMITKVTRLGLGATAEIWPTGVARIAAEMFMWSHRHQRPEREVKLIARAEPFQLKWAQGHLAGWVWGKGPTIILVHGWEGRGAQLGSFVEPLVAAGYRVVAFDGPGHGDSTGNQSSVVALATAINHVANLFAPVYGIISHSMGGAATTFAIKNGLKVARTAFLAPAARLIDFARQFSRWLKLKSSVSEKMQQIIEDKVGVKWELLDAPASVSEFDIPLLIVHDEDDREVPLANGREYVNAWPDAQLLITSGLGHRRILHEPVVVVRVVDFITQRRTLHPDAQSDQPKANLLKADQPKEIYLLGTRSKQCSSYGCNKMALPENRSGHCLNCAIEEELFDLDKRWQHSA